MLSLLFDQNHHWCAPSGVRSRLLESAPRDLKRERHQVRLKVKDSKPQNFTDDQLGVVTFAEKWFDWKTRVDVPISQVVHEASQALLIATVWGCQPKLVLCLKGSVVGDWGAWKYKCDLRMQAHSTFLNTKAETKITWYNQPPPWFWWINRNIVGYYLPSSNIQVFRAYKSVPLSQDRSKG